MCPPATSILPHRLLLLETRGLLFCHRHFLSFSATCRASYQPYLFNWGPLHTHTDTHKQTHRHTHTDMHTYTHPHTDTYSIVKGREWPVILFWLQPLLLAFLASPHGSAPQNLLTRAIVCLFKEKQRRPWKVIEQSGDCRDQCCEEGVLLLLLSRFNHVWLSATP